MSNFAPKATTDDPNNLTCQTSQSLATEAANSAAEFPIKLDGLASRVVARARKSRSKKEKEDEEEVLVIDGIEFDGSLPVKFDVYVNDEDGAAGGPLQAEFAGSFANVPRSQGRGNSNTMRTCLSLGITDLLENIGADDDESVVVTLVPKSGKGLISIGNIGIQLQA